MVGMQGEITLVVEGAGAPGDRVNSKDDLINALKSAMADGHSASSAVRLVKDQTGAAKRELYGIAVQLADGDSALASGSEDCDSRPDGDTVH